MPVFVSASAGAGATICAVTELELLVTLASSVLTPRADAVFTSVPDMASAGVTTWVPVHVTDVPTRNRPSPSSPPGQEIGETRGSVRDRFDSVSPPVLVTHDWYGIVCPSA